MGVTYELIDAPYPYLCAAYRCECGATAVQCGQDAGETPARWTAVPGEHEGEEHVLCPACATRKSAP